MSRKNTLYWFCFLVGNLSTRFPPALFVKMRLIIGIVLKFHIARIVANYRRFALVAKLYCPAPPHCLAAW